MKIAILALALALGGCTPQQLKGFENAFDFPSPHPGPMPQEVYVNREGPPPRVYCSAFGGGVVCQ